MAQGITLQSLKPARNINEKCHLIRQGLALWLHVVDHSEDRIPWGKIVAFDSRPCRGSSGLHMVYR